MVLLGPLISGVTAFLGALQGLYRDLHVVNNIVPTIIYLLSDTAFYPRAYIPTSMDLFVDGERSTYGPTYCTDIAVYSMLDSMTPPMTTDFILLSDSTDFLLIPDTTDIIVRPRGDIIVRPSGDLIVYQAPASRAAHVNSVNSIKDVHFSVSGTTGLFGCFTMPDIVFASLFCLATAFAGRRVRARTIKRTTQKPTVSLAGAEDAKPGALAPVAVEMPPVTELIPQDVAENAVVVEGTLTVDRTHINARFSRIRSKSSLPSTSIRPERPVMRPRSLTASDIPGAKTNVNLVCDVKPAEPSVAPAPVVVRQPSTDSDIRAHVSKEMLGTVRRGYEKRAPSVEKEEVPTDCISSLWILGYFAWLLRCRREALALRAAAAAQEVEEVKTKVERGRPKLMDTSQVGRHLYGRHHKSREEAQKDEGGDLSSSSSDSTAVDSDVSDASTFVASEDVPSSSKGTLEQTHAHSKSDAPGEESVGQSPTPNIRFRQRRRGRGKGKGKKEAEL